MSAVFIGRSGMRNIKLTIEYDGTGYHGWQRQENALSVQEVLEKALSKLTGSEVVLTSSGRTDTGVHALGQVANFFTQSTIPAERISLAVNNLLPDDIVVKKSEEVPPDFHSRFSATGKKYRYLIYNSRIPSAFMRNRAYHVYEALDLEAMKKASQYFLGEHDFAGFMASGSSVKTTVRTIYDVSLEKSGDLIEFQITGSGFLYNMVRIIAGTLVEVGKGKIRPDDIKGILESRDRTLAGITAPAHGLYLVEVYYGSMTEKLE